jgi:hypothetical protein
MAYSIGTIRTSLLLAAVALSLARPALAQEEVPAPPKFRDPHSLGLVGNMSCSSVTCHGRLEPQRRFGGDSGQEFVHWMHDDPHAKAARTLQSEWFYQILVKASAIHRDDGLPDEKIYRQCAACHDPIGLEVEKDKLTLPRDAESLTTRGIGCESCHGPAEKWVSNHFRGKSRESMYAAGMLNLKDLPTRARQCSQCHVGDKEHDLPHDFYGAGHPPLQFEVASFHALIKRKHWNEGKERRQIPEFEARLWLAGQLAGMEGSLELLHERAKKANDGPWPEFAEHDCQGCHQQFRPVGGEAYVLKGAFPQWRKWSFSSADLIAKSFPAANIDLPLKKIGEAMNELPPAAEPVAAQASSAGQVLKKLQLPAAVSRSLTSSLTNSAAGTELPAGAQWGEQTQRYLALISLESSGRDAFQLRPTGDATLFRQLTLDFKTRAYHVLDQLNRNPELKKTAAQSTLSSQPAGAATTCKDLNCELKELAEVLQRRDQLFPLSRD